MVCRAEVAKRVLVGAFSRVWSVFGFLGSDCDRGDREERGGCGFVMGLEVGVWGFWGFEVLGALGDEGVSFGEVRGFEWV
jgi:hypothetical protein